MKPYERNKRRFYGQNFLIDPQVIDDITEDVLNLSIPNWIIEIGPGKGAITKSIAPHIKNYTVIEKDPEYSNHIANKINHPSLEVFNKDASKFEWENYLQNHNKSKPTIIGNLPYNQANQILFQWLPHAHFFAKGYFMVQYEVAKRMTATPGNRNFGFLSVYLQHYAETKLARIVKPESFRPKPNVLSATVHFKPKENPPFFDANYLLFLKTSFQQKRKKLVNNLDKLHPKKNILKTLEELSLNENIRAEEIDHQRFITLFKNLTSRRTNE